MNNIWLRVLILMHCITINAMVFEKVLQEKVKQGECQEYEAKLVTMYSHTFQGIMHTLSSVTDENEQDQLIGSIIVNLQHFAKNESSFLNECAVILCSDMIDLHASVRKKFIRKLLPLFVQETREIELASGEKVQAPVYNRAGHKLLVYWGHVSECAEIKKLFVQPCIQKFIDVVRELYIRGIKASMPLEMIRWNILIDLQENFVHFVPASYINREVQFDILNISSLFEKNSVYDLEKCLSIVECMTHIGNAEMVAYFLEKYMSTLTFANGEQAKDFCTRLLDISCNYSLVQVYMQILALAHDHESNGLISTIARLSKVSKEMREDEKKYKFQKEQLKRECLRLVEMQSKKLPHIDKKKISEFYRQLFDLEYKYGIVTKYLYYFELSKGTMQDVFFAYATLDCYQKVSTFFDKHSLWEHVGGKDAFIDQLTSFRNNVIDEIKEEKKKLQALQIKKAEDAIKELKSMNKLLKKQSNYTLLIVRACADETGIDIPPPPKTEVPRMLNLTKNLWKNLSLNG